VGAWLIDFAKCTQVEAGIPLTHRDKWEPGNHEDGYLTGLDNLICLLEEDEEENGQLEEEEQRER
jgi:1D-myo-inositol-triphosphate 3-kinase